MLRQLVSKWGIMSIEMQSAIDSDMAVIREDGTKEYVEYEVQNDVVSEQEPEVTEGNTQSVQESSETSNSAVEENFFN